MTLYRRGSKGPEVGLLQSRLRELGLYPGPLDGIFGGGTESAVKSFQRTEDLKVDGVVGADTWKHLFPHSDIPEPALLQQAIAYRCLALTGSFETGAPVPECFSGLSGDFDGQGLSFGSLQWNLGQGSLQPLLLEMEQSHHLILEQLFDDCYPQLMAMLETDREEQLNWTRSIQDRKFRLVEPWRGLFKTLGRFREFQEIQVKAADQLYQAALKLCQNYGVKSERAVALMFDIKVQNGSISHLVKAQIEQDFRKLEIASDHNTDRTEVERLKIIANRRAEAANPRWIEDVRTRKLAIANGEGMVHGNYYNLAEQFGISLRAFTGF